jgi:hypothetical protein
VARLQRAESRQQVQSFLFQIVGHRYRASTTGIRGRFIRSMRTSATSSRVLMISSRRAASRQGHQIPGSTGLRERRVLEPWGAHFDRALETSITVPGRSLGLAENSSLPRDGQAQATFKTETLYAACGRRMPFALEGVRLGPTRQRMRRPAEWRQVAGNESAAA